MDAKFRSIIRILKKNTAIFKKRPHSVFKYRFCPRNLFNFYKNQTNCSTNHRGIFFFLPE